MKLRFLKSSKCNRVNLRSVSIFQEMFSPSLATPRIRGEFDSFGISPSPKNRARHSGDLAGGLRVFGLTDLR